VPGLAVLDRRLLVVTGKGGVGKSTLSSALALLAVRRGKRVLLCEVNVQERIAPLVAEPRSAVAPAGARGSLATLNVTPREAMREYGVMVLKFRTVYDAVFENRVVRYFLRVIPSLSELVMLGKILHEVRSEERGRPRWDLVVVDAPATGHAVQLLRVPAVLLDTIPTGPLRRDAEWMQALLVDPAVTSVVIVTLPEEMPVNEAVELDRAVRGTLRMRREAIVVNAMPERRFSSEERTVLAEARDDPAPLGPAATAAYLQALRCDESERHVARLRQEVDGSPVLVPLLARERWDRAAVEAVAGVLERDL
jgi:anion-transporting  ArsA/GET3 family ATPase